MLQEVHLMQATLVKGDNFQRRGSDLVQSRYKIWRMMRKTKA